VTNYSSFFNYRPFVVHKALSVDSMLNFFLFKVQFFQKGRASFFMSAWGYV